MANLVLLEDEVNPVNGGIFPAFQGNVGVLTRERRHHDASELLDAASW